MCEKTPDMFKPYAQREFSTFALESANLGHVPLAITTAQVYNAKKLLLTNIGDVPKYSRARIQWSKKQIASQSGLEYLAITNGTAINSWKWTSLMKSSLRTLHIENCPFREDHLPVKLVSDMSSDALTSLVIIKSRLKTIEDGALSQAVNLRMLSLAYNELSEIETATFGDQKLESLWWLDLSYNNLKEINGSVFEQLPQLTHLKLNENKFSTLGEPFQQRWSTFKQLEMKGNPLACKDICWTLKAKKSPNFFLHGYCYLYARDTHIYELLSIVTKKVYDVCQI